MGKMVDRFSGLELWRLLYSDWLYTVQKLAKVSIWAKHISELRWFIGFDRLDIEYYINTIFVSYT
jgi:hypothetical protein